MLDPTLGEFDWVVAMDSLIHYAPADMADMVAALAAKSRRGLVFTFAPRTPLLAVMHSVGRVFPKSDRSPDLEPIAEADLRVRLAAHPGLVGFAAGRSERIKAGFYTSQAMEIVRS
jgi:magnesium-protoporphyrin O-methyltransferase